MENREWEVIAEVTGDGQAEILKGLLEAQGIPVWLSQEGAGRAMGFSVGEMGTVQILVPASALVAAQDVLNRYEAGEFEERPVETDENGTTEVED